VPVYGLKDHQESNLDKELIMSDNTKHILEQGEGILRLAPAWVPRSFCIPGKRIRLHPADTYAFGAHRGGIDERWFSSTVRADNGPETLPDEGLSYVVYGDPGHLQKILFKELVEDLGAAVVGKTLWEKYHGWPVYAKFFDNQGALPHHLHQMQEHAEKVGNRTKPEAYYFPPQVNNHGGDFPYTFFGLEPGTSKEDVKHCLEIWDQGDNGILNLSKAYRLQRGTGWDIPAGILHAPGSLCTYEPQWGSDIYAMFQSLVNDVPLAYSQLTKYVPEDKKNDLDYIVSMIDWPANTSPNFKHEHFRLPRPVKQIKEMEADGYVEMWITYGNGLFSAKELTVLPGQSVIVKDGGACGVITVQGSGTIGPWKVQTPTLIRFGALTEDEFFVTAKAAQEGVRITNSSATEPLVMLKNFGPDVNSD
jgi:hypothetical protein